MYVLYKSCDQTYASQREHMGVMLVDDIHHENVDGEALLYAYARYQASGRKRWVCIVLSDGAPVDDSTLMANSEKILDEHVRATVPQLCEDRDASIGGLGVGFSVASYYPLSSSAAELDDIAPKLSALVELMLDQSKGGGMDF